MFIFSVKAQNIKLATSLAVSVLAIALVVSLVPNRAKDFVYPDEVLPAVKVMSDKDFKNIRDNDSRIAFLKAYGWEVEPDAREVVEVVIPEEFDTVYQKYNELQLAEGLDLGKYRGKSVKRYTYLVLNYEYDGTVLANLLIYKDRVIGGDLCSADADGFVHGFTKGNDFLGNFSQSEAE